MSSEWVETTWGEIATLEYGKSIRDYQNASGEYPVYGTNGPIGWHHTPLCPSAGVIIGRKGAYRGVHYSPKAFFVIDTAFYLKPKAMLDTKWTYYCLLTYDINGMDSGSAIPSTSRDEFYQLAVNVPPLREQRWIAEILGIFDDRIALLRETNATLEAIAQALFKSWFVDFDPVHAKARGESPQGMDDATAAQFPDSFEESELGMIPKGWRVVTIDNLCSQITNGGTPSRSKSEFWESGTIPWFKTGEFVDGFLIRSSEKITEAAIAGSSVKVLPENAVLMAIYAAPTVGRLGVLTEKATFNQACTGMVAKPEVGPWFLFLTLLFGRDWFNSRANGAAQQNISKAIVSGYSVVLPDTPILAAFNEITSSLFTKIRSGTEQAQTLAQLRDTLLPKLISGQLRLPEAEALLAEELP